MGNKDVQQALIRKALRKVYKIDCSYTDCKNSQVVDPMDFNEFTSISEVLYKSGWRVDEDRSQDGKAGNFIVCPNCLELEGQ